MARKGLGPSGPSKRPAPGGTLPQAGFIPAEEVKSHWGARSAERSWAIDHAVAGENMFHIDVREKEPLLTQ